MTTPERCDSAERFMAYETGASLARLEGSPLIGAGCVNVIGLEAIAQRLGDRWSTRREHVYGHVERMLARHLGATGWFVRLSQVDFLVVQPEFSRYAAQASCLGFMRELLNHFLGAARQQDVVLREVTELSAAGVETRMIDPVSIATTAEPRPAPASEESEPLARESDPAERQATSFRRWSPFVATDGRDMKVSCSLEPVFELRGYRLIGHRLKRRVIDLGTGEPLSSEQLQRLPRYDLERVDLASIERALSRVRSGADTRAAPTLMTPVSYATLSGVRGRNALIQCFRDAADGDGKRIICEIEHADSLPAGALAQTLALIKPFCFAVVGRVTAPVWRSARGLRASGLHGISADLTGHAAEEGAFMRQIESVAGVASAAARSLLATGLATPRHVALASLAGYTHASLAATAAV